MSLRVGILCEYATLNGGERSLLACLDRYSSDEVHVTCLAPPSGPLADELQRRSMPHVPFDLHGAQQGLSRAARIAQLVSVCRTRFDVLHANSLAMGRLTGAASRELAIPCNAHLRDIVRLSPAAIADLNGNLRLIAVSQAVRDFHVAQGLSAERTCVIYNGIDTATFRAMDRTGRLRRELGLPDESLLVAAIGQICLRKGQDVFAEAAVRMSPSLPMAHFLLIGSRHSTKRESIDYERNIVSRFAQAGLAHRFHPLGERTDVARLLPEIDILVHAARQEPFGRVLLEASACGVPIVATDVGGTAEMLTNGEHALLVPPDDPAAIADAVRRLVGDRELASQLGRAASRHVADRFPIERSARELLALWNRTVEAVGRQ